MKTTAVDGSTNSIDDILTTIDNSPSRISCALKCQNYIGCTTIHFDVYLKRCKLFKGSPKLTQENAKSSSKKSEYFEKVG